jgi:NitT/TauT family transport system substrate-binding protein/sulfonate transport system substrate-binding protein
MNRHRTNGTKDERTKISISVLVIFSLLLFNAGCNSRQTLLLQTRLQKSTASHPTGNSSTLRLAFISTNNAKTPTGPIGWAMYKNKFLPQLKPLGIEKVQKLTFPNGPNLNEAIVAGKVDVGILGDTPALVARANGAPTRLISQEQVGINAWLLAKKNGPSSVEKLQNQKVATSKGSYMHRYLLGLLQKFGIADKVTVVHLLPSEAQAALERGDVAAIAAPIGTGPLLKAKGFPVADVAIKHPDLPGTSVTVVTEAFLAKHPNLPQKWNQIRKAAVQDIKANPQQYYKFLAQTSGYPLDVVKESFPVTQFPEEPLSPRGIELLEGTKQFLVSQKLAKSDFKLSDWIAPQQQ